MRLKNIVIRKAVSLMQGSSPPKAWVMVGLSVLVVELPFFLGMILVQVLVRCGHCRGVWRTFWPILSGMIPTFILRAGLGGVPFQVILGLMAFGFITAVFLLSFRNRHWRLILAASGLFFSLLAVLTHVLIAS